MAQADILRGLLHYCRSGTIDRRRSVVAVEPGSVIYVPPGGKQSLENSGPTAIEFLCLVDPAWRPEDEEVLE